MVSTLKNTLHFVLTPLLTQKCSPYSYKRGKISAPETESSPYKEVHILYDHVPDVLRPPSGTRRTKWVFLTSVASKRQDAFDAYKEGNEMNFSSVAFINSPTVFTSCP